MNGFQKGKHPNFEKPFPGCLGRMVNLFDLGSVARNRLLTDKPHHEGSPLSRSQSDVSRTSPSADQIQDKVVMSEFWKTCSTEKQNGTSVKMLIDQEMSKEIDSPHNSPSVVAKLMGLDALPQKLPDLSAQRSHSVGYSRSLSHSPSSHWKEDGYFETELQHEFDPHDGQKGYKDIYEIWQQSCRTNCVIDKSPHKGRYDDTIEDKKMALVRQKFMEAKCMATDEKLRQSKQFQDALEVLSSNKDSFLKFIQEPNSLFSQHLYNMHSVPPPDTKRITVLRPSKMVDDSRFPRKYNEPHMKKTSQVNGLGKAHVGFSLRATNWKVEENPAQPTRIVVLKPGPGKPQDIQVMGSNPSSSPGLSHGGELFRELEHNAARESREVAKTIPQLMRENLDRRDEALLSSVFCNGYIGDESSFKKSEYDYAPGNMSDSEVMSPASRHSWDCVNRFDSPYSSSSVGRASYSPESSVCREAKKRLSERWAMMASNGSYQEPKHVRRSSNTLGEMLALSDIKKAGISEDCTNIEEPRAASAFLNDNLCKDERVDNSPINLMRSKSVPASSTASGFRLNVGIPNPEEAKLDVSQDAVKTGRSKSSFKGKVSSLFFSRSKKTNKERSSTSQSKGESFSDGISSCFVGNVNKGADHAEDSGLKCSSPKLLASSIQASSLKLNGKQSIIYSEAGLPVKKQWASGNTGENLDQPSPVSVLEPPFEEDENTTSESSYKADQHGMEVLAYPGKLNQIDKSPPIGSIARTLPREDSCVDTASSYPSKTSLSTRGVEEEEEECLFFIQTLLSVAGLNGEMQSNSLMARWHSSKSPLDPSLRDKYIDLNDKEILQEARRRQRRSMQKLVFDCVNAALIDVSGYGSETCQRAIPESRHHSGLLDSRSFKMEDQVWAWMKEWFSGETRCVWGDDGDVNNLVVDRLVSKEVVGKGWVEHLGLEMDNLGKEIEQNLLQELVQDAVIDLTG